MGYYLNPTNMTKEAWLQEYGIKVDSRAAAEELRDANWVPVCLVHNGGFTAAGVAFDENESKNFEGDGTDLRLKMWFVAPKEEVMKMLPGIERVWT